MPNWCNNHVTIHAQPDVINRIKNALEHNELFNEFFPMPEELKDTPTQEITPDWLQWRMANWGVKWDVSDHVIMHESETHITVNLGTAWAPPITFYDDLMASGQIHDLTALYFEPDCLFGGIYENGCDTEITLNYFSSYEDFCLNSPHAKRVAEHPWLDECFEAYYEIMEDF